jgi:hypothetical protein
VARAHLRHAYLEVPSFATQAAIVIEALVQSPRLEAGQSHHSIASHAGARDWNWHAVAAGTHRLMALVPDAASRPIFDLNGVAAERAKATASAPR